MTRNSLKLYLVTHIWTKEKHLFAKISDASLIIHANPGTIRNKLINSKSKQITFKDWKIERIIAKM